MSEMASVTSTLLELCESVAARLPLGDERSTVTAVRAKLAMPLQVTVGGGVSSGKSTLVNALLGQRVAAVDAGECTRVVTRFCYGHHERAEVVGTDGSTRTLALTDGAVPAELGVPLATVREVVVYLPNQPLTEVNIIDTPGMNTVTAENEASTVGFLGLAAQDEPGRETAARISRADALIFLMPHLRQADIDVLAGFRTLFAGSGLSAFNAVGVLSRIDHLTRHGDPRDAARSIASRIRSQAAGLVSDVLPFLGLLAETGATAALTEADARALVQIAGFGDDLDREDLLVSADSFLDEPALAVPLEQRRRLLQLLDLYGIGVCCAAIDAGSRGTVGLLEMLVDVSGLTTLRRLIFDRLGAHAGLIKARSAIADLRRLSYRPVSDPAIGAELGGLRTHLDRFEFDPTLHELRVLAVLQDAATGAFRLPEPLMRDLERLAASTDPLVRCGVARMSDLPQAAATGASLWGRFANDPRRSPADAHRGRVVKEAYELLWQQGSTVAGASR